MGEVRAPSGGTPQEAEQGRRLDVPLDLTHARVLESSRIDAEAKRHRDLAVQKDAGLSGKASADLEFRDLD